MADDTDFPSDETLLAYVQGQATAEEGARIEALAQERPALAADIALMRGIGQSLAAETEGRSPGDFGWARLNRALEAEAPARRFAPPRILQFAAAAAAAVVVWQVVAVPLLPSRVEAPDGLGLANRAETGPVLLVAFVPDATEAEMRALLFEAGARVVDGPRAIGLWTVAFPSETARDAGLALFGTRPDVVESAQAE